MSKNIHFGKGIDLGTGNVVAARQVGDKVEYTRIRDAFLDLEPEAKKTLRLSKVDYVELGGQIIVIGDAALTMANLFKREVRRPLSQGIIAAGEHQAQQVLSLIIKSALKEPQVANEHCFYCVPAAPIDNPGQDVFYHQEIFRKILTEQGYTAHPLNEAMAIIYSQCAAENFSGVGCSFGAGMVNVALAYQTVKGLEYSLSKSGDWIDQCSAKAMGSTASRICAIKEKGVDLNKPEGREQEAIAMYTRAVIRNSLESLASQFKLNASTIEIPEAIPLVVSGGTSKPKGFLDVFNEELEGIKKKGFPIQISEVRSATDPMTAVAEGLLVLASEEHAEG